jgi:pimeloyl-ACP methyl ester carboxylesterase
MSPVPEIRFLMVGGRRLAYELGAERAGLLGGSSSGCAAIAFAARFPERVACLMLYGSYADGPSITPLAVREAIVATVRSHASPMSVLGDARPVAGAITSPA